MNSYDIAGKLKLSHLRHEAKQNRLYRLSQPKGRTLWGWFW